MELNTHNKTLWMVQTAILAAIVFLMAFTPLGYLKSGPVSITFLPIPVVIGAVMVGPICGLILGGIFGLTSLIQCFGMDAFGTALMSINPLYTVIMTMVPRLLMGWLVGVIFKGASKKDPKGTWSYVLASFCGPALNTLLFVSALILFFRDADVVRELGDNVKAIVLALISTNALIEAVVCTIAASAITKVLAVALNHSRVGKNK
ncbi:MAG: ECF transporter S component [Clostridia bacterium]|nr:ECF transporter S component [Clostridia bacterium]